MSEDQNGAFDGLEVGSTLDAFLDEPDRRNNTRKGMTLNWRKEGSVTVYLHPTAHIHTFWATNWPRIVEYDDKNGDHLVRVFSRPWVSHEPHAVLQRQFFRDKAGRREVPPQTCPMSLFLEWLYQEIQAGRINWTAPVFVFDRKDLTDAPLTIHAGGACGLFQQTKKHTPEMRAELRRAKDIVLKEAYRENLAPKEQYLFQVVDAGDLEAGIQTAIEGSALGRSFREAIKDERRKATRKGNADLGDPRKVHYAFEWQYDADADFSARYKVIALTDEIASPEIEAILQSDPPSVEKHIAFGDVEELRTEMETFCVLDKAPPWDLFFEKTSGARAPAAAPKKPREEPKSEKKAAAPKDDAPSYDCDACGESGDDPDKCAKCGATYDKSGRASRPCGSCSEPIELPAGSFAEIKDERVTCSKCGAVHNVGTWAWAKVDAKAETPRRRRGA